MTNKELEVLARKHQLQHFLTPSLLSRRDGETDFEIDRRYIIEHLVLRDNYKISFWAAAVSIVGAVFSLVVRFF